MVLGYRESRIMVPQIPSSFIYYDNLLFDISWFSNIRVHKARQFPENDIGKKIKRLSYPVRMTGGIMKALIIEHSAIF